MRVVRRKEKANKAAEAWHNQYCVRGKWNNGPWGHSLSKEEVYHALVGLGEYPDPDDVDAVIGNGSWTRVSCDDCGCACEEAVEVGQDPDYESSTAVICKPCLRKAVKLV